jgi:hypothetical protein
MFDHPLDAPDLFDDPRFKLYLVTCDWMRNVFRPYYGHRCVSWYAGMDTSTWVDTQGQPKPIDVLVYDKIRWQRSTYERELLQPILSHLEKRGLRYEVIRYGQYHHRLYTKLLRVSQCMVFLCEHETQGLAYQEALASNVPIIAWDQGFWLDPKREHLGLAPIAATSVPYFSPECGERFGAIDAFAPTFEIFWAQIGAYTPRRFVERELTMTGSARLYAEQYFSLGPSQHRATEGAANRLA